MSATGTKITGTATLQEKESDIILLEIRSRSSYFECDFEGESTTVPTRCAWELPTSEIQLGIAKVLVHRNRLIEYSSYFRSLLEGGFKESSLKYVNVEWGIDEFLFLLRYFYGNNVDLSFVNFVFILESALFFGVEVLLLECRMWITHALPSKKMKVSSSLLSQLIDIWIFGTENGICYISEIVANFLAINFDEIICHDSFERIPFQLLKICISHSQLTVSSEGELCIALLTWLETNHISVENRSDTCNNALELLERVRIGLLPLEFTLGPLWRAYPSFVKLSLKTHILDHILCTCLNKDCAIEGKVLNKFKLRLTQYSEKVDLSGCQQFTGMLLYLSLFPSTTRSGRSLTTSLGSHTDFHWQLKNQKKVDEVNAIQSSELASPFNSLKEVNLSRCWRIDEDYLLNCLKLSSPSLRVLKASYCHQLKPTILSALLQAFHLIEEVDLSLDITKLVSQNASVVHTSHEEYFCSKSYSNMQSVNQSFSSKLTKLSLEGHTDLADDDLIMIVGVTPSLSLLNINGCISLTDHGITNVLKLCKKLCSLHVASTSFGKQSAMQLNAETCASSSLSVIDMSNCKDLDRTSITNFMRLATSLTSLSMWNSLLSDECIYAFHGTLLEQLDVSQTLVSTEGLNYLVVRNPCLKVLRARDCKQLSSSYFGKGLGGLLSCQERKGFHHVISHLPYLKELSIGWGLSGIFLEFLKPALSHLKSFTVGIGGSMTSQAWKLLPEICPLIEDACFCFQVISDENIFCILKNLKYLQSLKLQYCLGDLTSKCLTVSCFNLKVLKLERVSPWLTDDDLIHLSECFKNLCQLSLSGCRLLTSDVQHIIASQWPGLTTIHLEECPNITANGVSNLLECKAVEDLSLLHTGSGIKRSFVLEAVNKLPLLRNLALDLCDACEKGFETPHHLERKSLCTVKLTRCKLQKNLLNSQGKGPGIEHFQTILLEWNSKEARTTVLSERI